LTGKTATVLSGGLICDARKNSAWNNETAAAPKRRPAVAAPTSLGLRCDQRHIRAGGDTGRATIGRPSSQRSKSAARSRADWYALLDHVRDSVHKSSPNPDRAMVPASVVLAPAFQTLDESLKPDWNPGMVDVQQAR